ncbi:hypothetical protein RFI_37295 [Reticulomyxa filosa]|uniref:Uncharacterized protein n=1 Tax=Reticulomyxa filosa TaxID=46433 RepID=X6LF11_RETFI|nr:hypothetical protein RFI_37295 [Reticulomyxa filosa]|eukprot:ETO00164.1 hypothetical protein RFI_37295 [Reticulomyxa filosa]
MNCVPELVLTLVRIILSIQSHLSAFAYVFTKFPDDQKESIHALVDDTYNIIQEEETDEGYKALLADIADQTEYNVLASDLLNDSTKILLKELANAQKFIKDPDKVFHPFLKERSTSAVNLQVEKHKASILHAFKHHHYPIVQIKLDELVDLQSVLKNDTIEITYRDCINQLTHDWNTQINVDKHKFNKCIKEDILAYKQTIDKLKSADPLRRHLYEAICMRPFKNIFEIRSNYKYNCINWRKFELTLLSLNLCIKKFVNYCKKINIKQDLCEKFEKTLEEIDQQL